MVGNISLSGFSGIDTEEIITQLLSIEQRSLTSLEERKVSHEDTKQIWSNVNTKLLSLRSSSEALLDRFNWEAVKSTVSDSSKISASTVVGAATGSYSFDVISKGTSAYVRGDQIDFNSSLNIQTTLKNVSDWGALAGQSGSFKITVDGKETTINWDGDTDTVANIINKINRSGAGVTAFYDEEFVAGADPYKGRFILTSNSAGNFSIDVTDETGAINFAEDFLKIVNPAEKEDGINAEVKLNGVAINPKGNTFTVNGLTVNFIETGKTTVNVTRDTEKILDLAKDFISAYNDVQDYFDEVASTDVGNRGPLAGNHLIQNLKSRMPTMLMSPYNWGDGAQNFQLANQLGISFGEFHSDEKNHLVLDEAKFLAAYTENPQSVQNFFGYNSSGSNPATGVKNAGLAHEMKTFLQPITQYRGLIYNEQNSLDVLVKNLDERMERELTRIETKEASLRRQFSYMEQALQTLNSQGEYFQSQLAQLSN